MTSSSSAVPSPPDPFPLNDEPWPAGKRIWRIHPGSHGANEFYATEKPARFRPIYDKGGEVVPSLYGGEDLDTAVAETIFHDLPTTAGPKYVARSTLDGLVASVLEPTPRLRLAQFRGHGLRRLGTTHGKLIDTEAASYPEVRPRGQAAYDHELGVDGIVWMARQHNTHCAVVVWESRVARDDLQVVEAESYVPIWVGSLFDEVCRIAMEAGVTIST